VDVPEEVMEENMHRALSSVVLDRRGYLVYRMAYLGIEGSTPLRRLNGIGLRG
jgi:hypothetical protein